jgi:toxin ParE1/3/4
MKLIWADQAIEDLADIWEYLTDEISVDIADTQVLRLQKEAEELLVFPTIGRKRDDLQKGLRSLKSGSYLIFYQVGAKSETVEILHVYHGHRDLEALFN